jgi:hypothetical protein
MSCGDNCNCKGIKDVHNTDDYERGYSKGFLDGFAAARRDPSLVYPHVPNDGFTEDMTKCKVCSIDFSRGVWGYVCNHPKCPTKVTY